MCVCVCVKTNSPTLMILGSTLLTASDNEGQRGRRHLSSAQATSQQRSGKASSPKLSHSEWLTYAPSTRANSTVLPRQGTGPNLPSAAADEGQSSPALMSQGSDLLTAGVRMGGKESTPHPCHLKADE